MVTRCANTWKQVVPCGDNGNSANGNTNRLAAANLAVITQHAKDLHTVCSFELRYAVNLSIYPSKIGQKTLTSFSSGTYVFLRIFTETNRKQIGNKSKNNRKKLKKIRKKNQNSYQKRKR